jgi:large subunit ribosomal protein L29
MKATNIVREIRESSEQELSGRLSRLEAKLFELRLKHATNQIENVSQIRTTRREIARVLTVLGERRNAKAAPQATPRQS